MKDANQQNSKTDEFRHPDYIVVRRGRTINFAVKMSSSNFNAQAVQLELQRGNNPDYDRGNKFLGTCTKEPRKHYEWEMKVRHLTQFLYNCMNCYLLFTVTQQNVACI